MDACRGAHVVLVLTEWSHFREIDPAVVDGRNCLDREAWREAGWIYRGLGRP